VSRGATAFVSRGATASVSRGATALAERLRHGLGVAEPTEHT
jgi:hypothetical protein